MRLRLALEALSSEAVALAPAILEAGRVGRDAASSSESELESDVLVSDSVSDPDSLAGLEFQGCSGACVPAVMSAENAPLAASPVFEDDAGALLLDA